MTARERTIHAMHTVTSDLLGDLRSEIIHRLRSEGYEVPTGDLGEVVQWWCAVQARRIDRRPRRVDKSREFQARTLPPHIDHALRRLFRAITDGRNLNPHLSRKRLDATFSDALFNDWQIHHMHLGPPGGGKRSPGTSELAFVHVTPDAVRMIDILDHGAFSAARLAEILDRNWPAVTASHVLKGVVGLDRTVTDEERAMLRAAGVNVLTELGGRVHAPWGGGQTTAKSSLQARREAIDVVNGVKSWTEILGDANFVAAAVSQKSGQPAPQEIRLRLQVRGDAIRVIETSTCVVLLKTS